MPWFIFISFTCFVAAIIERVRFNGKNILYLFVCFLLIMTAGFRNMGGTDYEIYKNDYNGVKSYDTFRTMFEIGYNSLTQFFRTVLGFNYNQFIFVYSFVLLSVLFYSFKKLSAAPLLSICIYLINSYLYYNLVALRQMFPLSIMLYTLYVLSKKKYLLFIILVFLGTIFHNSFIIVLLLVPFILKFNPTKVNLIVVFAASVVLHFIISTIIPVILSALNFQNLTYRMGYLLNPDIRPMSLLFAARIIATACFIVYNKKLVKGRFLQYVFNCFIVFLISVIVFPDMDVVFRFNSYFELSVCILIPYLLLKINYTYKTRLLLNAAISFMSLIVFLRYIINFDNGVFMNYSFYFL